MRTVKIYLTILAATMMVFVLSCSDGGNPDNNTVEYNIRVRGFLDGESTDFTCMIRNADSTGGTFIAVDSVINIGRPGSGTFVVIAEKEGYIVHPAADTVILSTEFTAAEVFFMFHEEGNDTGTTSGNTTHFFLQNDNEDPWPVIITGPEGQDTVDIASGGSFWQTDAGTGDVIVIRPEREGYCAVPESLVLLLSEDNGAFTFEFEFIEQRYVIIACAEFSGMDLPFDLLLSGETGDTLLNVPGVGIRLELPSTGEYTLFPAHPGLVPEYTEYTVNLSGCTDSAYLCIQFMDTTTYSLSMTIAGRLDAAPTGFSARYRQAMPGADWDTVDIGPSGSMEIDLTEAGYYMVQAWKTACITSPEEVMQYLDGDHAASTATFTFTDTTTTPKSIEVSGTIDAVPTSFNIRWKGDWESDWHEDSIDGSETFHVYPDGEMVFEAEKAGFVALPATRTLSVEGEGTSYSVNFCFADSFGYLAEAGIYVSDWYNYRVVRINSMTGDGWTTVGPLSGYGVIDGPSGVQVDIFGRIYIVDRGHGKLIRLETFAADSPYETFTTGYFDLPQKVEFDSRGRIYVTDGSTNNIVRFDDLEGTNIVAFNSPGHPSGIALDSEGRIYITYYLSDYIIRIDDMDGSGLVSYGSSGSGMHQFNYPNDIEIDDEDKIYISDKENNRIVRVDDLSGDGWTTLEETSVGPIDTPESIAFSKGYIYISLYDHIIRILNFDGDRAVSYGTGGDGIGEFHHLLQIDVVP